MIWFLPYCPPTSQPCKHRGRAEGTETTVPSALQVYTGLIRERGCQFAGWPACRFLCNSRAHLLSQACLWTKQVLLWAVDSFLVMALVCEQWELLQVLLFVGSHHLSFSFSSFTQPHTAQTGSCFLWALSSYVVSMKNAVQKEECWLVFSSRLNGHHFTQVTTFPSLFLWEDRPSGVSLHC